MTNDDIIRLANEARLCGCKWVDDDDDRDVESLYDFVALVVAAEREACAVIAFNAKTYLEAAAAIRKR
jgi:hypothetical protein